MIKTIQSTLYRLSSGRMAVLGVLIFAAFMVFVLPNQAERADVYSGDVGSPDQSFFYSGEDLRTMAEAYGPEGRQAYVRARFTFDLVFPFVYGLFFVSLIGWALSIWTTPDSRWRPMIFVPVLGMLFDFLENSAAAFFMARYPADAPLAAALAPVFTALKWIFVGGSFPVLVGAWIGWAVAFFSAKIRTHATD